jgi:hypothetical protein
MRPRPLVSGVMAWWTRRGSALLLLAVVGMVMAAIWRLGHALPFLMWTGADPHPTDLHARFRELSRWFDGTFVSTRSGKPDYPPASYVLLWPLLGWLSVAKARWVWGMTGMLSLSVLAYQTVKESGAGQGRQQLLLYLIPFSAYATAATMSVGQLANHVLPMLLAGLLLLYRGRGRWRDDLAATAMLLFALVKPVLSAPFFWIVCFAIGRVRPIVLVTVGYMGITLFAASFIDESLPAVLTGWTGETPNLWAGHVNLQKWLALMGLHTFLWPATLAILVAFGGWVLRYRNVDFWILLGVAALVTRLGFHHRLYDDLLLLIPMVSLFRVARAGAETDGVRVLAGILFGLTWATLMAPAQLFTYSPPVPTLTEAGQAVVWIAVLIFLLAAARRDAAARPGASRRTCLSDSAPLLGVMPGSVMAKRLIGLNG